MRCSRVALYSQKTHRKLLSVPMKLFSRFQCSFVVVSMLGNQKTCLVIARLCRRFSLHIVFVFVASACCSDDRAIVSALFHQRILV